MPQIRMQFTSEKSDSQILAWLKENFDKNLVKRAGYEKIEVAQELVDGKLNFKGRTVKGHILVDSGNIEIVVTVPLLYRPFIPRIKAAVAKVLKDL